MKTIKEFQKDLKAAKSQNLSKLLLKKMRIRLLVNVQTHNFKTPAKLVIKKKEPAKS